MTRIPDTDLQRLKNEVSVQRLVEASGVALKKGGKDFTGKCRLAHTGQNARLPAAATSGTDVQAPRKTFASPSQNTPLFSRWCGAWGGSSRGAKPRTGKLAAKLKA